MGKRRAEAAPETNDEEGAGTFRDELQRRLDALAFDSTPTAAPGLVKLFEHLQWFHAGGVPIDPEPIHAAVREYLLNLLDPQESDDGEPTV